MPNSHAVGPTPLWLLMVLCVAITCGGCRTQPHQKMHKATAREARTRTMTSLDSTLRSRIPRRLTIILAERPDLNGKTLRIQDYIRDGRSFIPIFESPDALRAATGGTDLDLVIWEIDRAFFVSILKGNETLVLNPSLNSELTFSAADLRRAFPDAFVPRPATPETP